MDKSLQVLQRGRSSAEVSAPPRAERSLLKPITNLTLLCSLAGLCWLVALPAMCRTASFRERDQFLGERGIDPSAMIYTELDRWPHVVPHSLDKQGTTPLLSEEDSPAAQ